VVQSWTCWAASCTLASGSVAKGSDGSCSKNANTLMALGEVSVMLEPVDCLRAVASGAAWSLFCLRLALALAARRERGPGSWAIVEPPPLDPPKVVVKPENSDRRDDGAFFLMLDRRPWRS
jgi:hypothetical protein